MSFCMIKRDENGYHDSRRHINWCKTRALASIFCSVLVLACTQRAVAKDVAVVLNKNVKIQSITMSDLVKVCKGQMSRWPDGRLLTLVILDPESPEMRVVVQKVYKLTPSDVRTLIMTTNHTRTNRRSMIMVVSSAAELVRTVESLPGAIGLVDVYSITGGISVLKLEDKLPLQPGYWLHGN
jgi:hypothetical protein